MILSSILFGTAFKWGVFVLLSISTLVYPSVSSAQAYKWIDDSGNSHYTDNPYNAPQGTMLEKIGGADDSVFFTASKTKKNTTRMKTSDDEKSNPQGKGLTLVGTLEINHSESGKAVLQAVLLNESDKPASGIRLDVILFHVDRKRLDFFIPLTGGKKNGWLEPGEKGTIRHETKLSPDDMAGFRYRIVWDTMNLEKVPKKVKK